MEKTTDVLVIERRMDEKYHIYLVGREGNLVSMFHKFEDYDKDIVEARLRAHMLKHSNGDFVIVLPEQQSSQMEEVSSEPINVSAVEQRGIIEIVGVRELGSQENVVEQNGFSMDFSTCFLKRDRKVYFDKSVNSPELAVSAMYEIAKDFAQEVAFVILLDVKKEVVGTSLVSIGGLTSACIDIPVVLRSAILSGASGIILLHTHPSGKLKPSREDIEITDRLLKACDIVGVNMVDHIIVGDAKNYYSMKQAGFCEKPSINLVQSIEGLVF